MRLDNKAIATKNQLAVTPLSVYVIVDHISPSRVRWAGSVVRAACYVLQSVVLRDLRRQGGKGRGVGGGEADVGGTRAAAVVHWGC